MKSHNAQGRMAEKQGNGGRPPFCVGKKERRATRCKPEQAPTEATQRGFLGQSTQLGRDLSGISQSAPGATERGIWPERALSVGRALSAPRSPVSPETSARSVGGMFRRASCPMLRPGAGSTATLAVVARGGPHGPPEGGPSPPSPGLYWEGHSCTWRPRNSHRESHPEAPLEEFHGGERELRSADITLQEIQSQPHI